MMPKTPPNPAAAKEDFIRGFELAGKGDWVAAWPYFRDAFQTDPQNLRYWLFFGGALFHKDREEDAVAVWSMAADRDAMIRIAQFQPQIDALTKEVSRLADQEIRRTMTQVQSGAISKTQDAGRLQTAMWPQTHFGPVPYRKGGSRPYMFFVPDFPDKPVFDRKDAAWTKRLEAKTAIIRDEFLSLFTGGNAGEPYVSANSFMGPEWESLKGQRDWTSLHLYQDGQEKPSAKACPQTCEVIKTLPVVLHHGQPMEVFFSVLKPGTHIPPHFGLANCRLTVHLPLIIPETCAIRVKDTQHVWAEGETFLFDDSFNHEAWNKSEDMRVVLIFEAWRPDMTDGEIMAAEASYAARDTWLRSRNIEKILAA